MKKRRVVITGLGIVSPVGNTVAKAWRNILNGTSGIATLENIDTEDQAVTFGGSVKNFNVSEYLSSKEAKKMDIFIHYGMAAGIQAIEDRVRKVVSEQLDVSGDIDNNASFIDDLGADSLDTVELVMSLEEEFDCEIADEEAENITTIQQAIDYINANT